MCFTSLPMLVPAKSCLDWLKHFCQVVLGSFFYSLSGSKASPCTSRCMQVGPMDLGSSDVKANADLAGCTECGSP